MNWLKSLPIHLLIAFMLTVMALPSVGLIIYSGIEGRSDDLRISTRATTYLLDNIASELNSKVEAIPADDGGAVTDAADPPQGRCGCR
ncbi:hypothetical protein [Geomonas anaerohicana]|uniref:Uncharacterized protein n=1 Tax=Geomonas anaerohicana TaxID=2798583 RepID=A0ABS0YIA0_9BACT|nr:hypothetical protein [Geomonas anaerohicana]MBJ6752055.1 hypothetical protein [Geomonas anaerohicana]